MQILSVIPGQRAAAMRFMYVPLHGHAIRVCATGVMRIKQEKKEGLSACHGEGSAAGLQLRVRVVHAAVLAMLGTALALQCVSKARDRTGHGVR